MLVRVPCNPHEYITANYGSNWSRPIQDWDWRTSPPNSQLNGFWATEERRDAIYLNPKYYDTNEAAEPQGELQSSLAKTVATAVMGHSEPPEAAKTEYQIA